MNKKIRWKQRFDNLSKAYSQLKNGLNIDSPNETECQGIIQSFEFTFELSWKTLKDYLENKGSSAAFPRDVIKEAFQHEIIKDGEIWLDMLAKRNLFAHTYDEKTANQALELIRQKFYPAISTLMRFFKKEK